MVQYQRMLREKGIRQSMSRKGNCLDKAVQSLIYFRVQKLLLQFIIKMIGSQPPICQIRIIDLLRSSAGFLLFLFFIKRPSV